MMKAANFVLLMTACVTLVLADRANPQRTQSQAARKSIQATVCQIWDSPWALDNRIVQVRGYVVGGFETSVLVDSQCTDKAIWFQFAGGAAAPELEAITQSTRPMYARKDKPRVAVKLQRDANLELLRHYWETSAKGERCTENTPTNELPDCRTYRVTATFVGRVDGVSKAVHIARLKKSLGGPTDWKGFGHMGYFDAQIVASSVEDVEAAEEQQ